MNDIFFRGSKTWENKTELKYIDFQLVSKLNFFKKIL